MKRLVYLFVYAVFFTSLASAQQCPSGEIEDCNGYCAPMAWLLDEICDEEAREYPEGSGYYVDFSCEFFMCDVFACEGCSDECPVGLVPDCNGNCIPGEYISDGICDMGQRFYNDVPVDFSCQFFNCDMGDCAGSCWNDLGMEGLDDFGACCLGTECTEMTRGECWTLGYTFAGNNTTCLPETCGCGDGWIADCNGECVLLWDIGGNYCSHGQMVDYGDGPFEMNLDCPALACGLSGCVGNCSGPCCTGADCITISYYDCVEIGGLFLGSYELCDETGCASEQKPIQLPDTELYWSGKLGDVEDFPQWIISEEDLLVVGAIDNSTFEWKTAICIFRYNESEDEWDEEALLVAPGGYTDGHYASYTTDGHRIAVTSSIQNEKETFRNVIDIFAFNGSDWLHEQTIDDSTPVDIDGDNYRWAASLDILGDVLVIGDPMYNFQPDTNFGAAHIYHHDISTGWAYDSILAPWGDPPYPDGDDQYLGLSVALSESVLAVASAQSILLYDISGDSPLSLQHIRDTDGSFHARHRSMDFDNDRLMTHVTYGGPASDVNYAGSKIFEFDGADWVATSELMPFDLAVANDWAGYIVDLQGDRAMITSPRDNDLGHSTGSAYIWEYNNSAEGEWIFKSKLWSDRAVGGDEFGIGGALHGSNAYLTGIVQNPDGDGIKVFWPRGISWINPLGGNLSDALNWDPTMPLISDSVSFSLRSQTPILVDQELPFQRMFIGLGTYEFNLDGVNRTLGDGGETINLQGVPGIEAEFKLRGGVLNVTGDVHVGEDDLPGKVSLVSNSAGQIGKILIDGLYLQHNAGELLLELQEPYPDQTALVQLSSVSPQLDGVLSLNLAEGYVPEDGDIIPLLTSEVVDSNAGQFSMVMVNDPLPEGLYIKLLYEGGEEGSSGSISAEVELLSNLFGYGDPSSGPVGGTATDVVLSDLGSSSRTIDGFDDVVVTTNDLIYIFLSDGAGGFSSQVTYNDSDSDATFTSLAAVSAGDLDGDGTNDLVVVNSTTNEFIPIFNPSQDVSLLSIGDPVGTGPFPTDVLAINTDGDGDDDVIVACYGYSFTDGQIDFFAAVPTVTGGFVSSGSLPSPGNPGKINPGDVNTDKDIKVYVSFGSSNSAGQAGQNSGLRGFNWAYEAMMNVATGPSDIVIGDLNGDLVDDVVVSCPESDVLTLLTSNNDGSFSNPLYLYVGDEPTSIQLLDFDNDGDKDIAVVATNPETQLRAVMLYRNDTSNNGGNLMFANDAQYDEGDNPILVAKGDIDGDDHDDLISITQASSFRGTTTEVQFRQSDAAPSCPADFDGNGEVNVLDLLDLIGAWGETGKTPQDLNGDSVVTVLDLLVLIGAWGPCT